MTESPDDYSLHSFNAKDSEWNPAAIRAKENGETVTDVLRRALREYGSDDAPSPLADAIREAVRKYGSKQ